MVKRNLCGPRVTRDGRIDIVDIRAEFLAGEIAKADSGLFSHSDERKLVFENVRQYPYSRKVRDIEEFLSRRDTHTFEGGFLHNIALTGL